MAVWYHRLSWKALQMSYCIYLRKTYNVELISCPEEPEPPYIFLANHAHRADPFILGAFSKKAMSYVANVEAVSVIRKIGGRLVGVVPKTKGRPDFSAVKKIFQLLRDGNIVGIFAEGDRSWDGETDRIIENIPGILKKADTPVRLARLTGNYLSLPRWSDTKRHGKIYIEFFNMSRHDIRSLSKGELHGKICELLYRNDIKDEKMLSVAFRGVRLASGIQYLLWLCPSCKAHDSLYGIGDEIVCRSCGANWRIDGNLRLSSESAIGVDLKDWSDWQKSQINRMCIENGRESLTVSNNIEMKIFNNNEVRFKKDGDITLFKDRLVFGSHEENIRVVFNIAEVNYYIDNFNKYLQFIHRGEKVRLDFKGKNASKWIYFFRCLQGYH